MYKTNKFDFYSTAVEIACYFLWIFILFFNPCTRIVSYHIIHASFILNTLLFCTYPPPNFPWICLDMLVNYYWLFLSYQIHALIFKSHTCIFLFLKAWHKFHNKVNHLLHVNESFFSSCATRTCPPGHFYMDLSMLGLSRQEFHQYSAVPPQVWLLQRFLFNAELVIVSPAL